MGVEISVIVPVYNVEKYLPLCLLSIERQTFNDFELILVDDGSPDNCAQICDTFAAKHPNVKVIHQTNQGLSAARNHGIRTAVGKFITFVDSDDVVSDDYLSTLYELIVESNADVSVGKLLPFWGEGMAERKVNKDTYSINKYGVEKALEEMLYGVKYGVQACAKLFRREVIENVEFPEGKLHEDQGTTYKIIGRCNTLICSDKLLYFYRQRSTSIVHTRVTQAHLYGLEAVKEQLEYIRKYHPSIVPAAEFRFAIVIFKWIPGITSRKVHDKEMFAYLRGELMPYYHSIMHNPRVNKAMKVRTLAVKCGYYPAGIVFRVIDFMKRVKSKRLVLT